MSDIAAGFALTNIQLANLASLLIGESVTSPGEAFIHIYKAIQAAKGKGDTPFANNLALFAESRGQYANDPTGRHWLIIVHREKGEGDTQIKYRITAKETKAVTGLLHHCEMTEIMFRACWVTVPVSTLLLGSPKLLESVNELK